MECTLIISLSLIVYDFIIHNCYLVKKQGQSTCDEYYVNIVIHIFHHCNVIILIIRVKLQVLARSIYTNSNYSSISLSADVLISPNGPSTSSGTTLNTKLEVKYSVCIFANQTAFQNDNIVSTGRPAELGSKVSVGTMITGSFEYKGLAREMLMILDLNLFLNHFLGHVAAYIKKCHPK